MLWPGSVRLSRLRNLQKWSDTEKWKAGERQSENLFANSWDERKMRVNRKTPKSVLRKKGGEKYALAIEVWVRVCVCVSAMDAFPFPPSLFTWNQIELKEEKGNKSISFDSVFGGPDCIECKSFPLCRPYIYIHINFITCPGGGGKRCEVKALATTTSILGPFKLPKLISRPETQALAIRVRMILVFWLFLAKRVRHRKQSFLISVQCSKQAMGS